MGREQGNHSAQGNKYRGTTETNKTSIAKIQTPFDKGNNYHGMHFKVDEKGRMEKDDGGKPRLKTAGTVNGGVTKKATKWNVGRREVAGGVQDWLQMKQHNTGANGCKALCVPAIEDGDTWKVAPAAMQYIKKGHFLSQQSKARLAASSGGDQF